MNERNPFLYYDRTPRPGVSVRATAPAPHPGDPEGLSPAARRDLASARSILATHGLEVSVRRTAPTFRPGDVLVVRFPGNPTAYTYVRGRRDWPGDGMRKTDAEMAALWQEGKAHLVIRDGQHYSDSRSPAAQTALSGGVLL